MQSRFAQDGAARFFGMELSLNRRPATVEATAPRLGNVVDRVGATASLLCAIHCMLLPFVLAALPLIGLGFLAGHTFERVFVTCAALLAAFSIVMAYRQHGRPHALLLMVPGIALLITGIAIDLDAHVAIHTACVVSGGLLVASAHVTNLVLAHRHRHSTCTHCPAHS